MPINKVEFTSQITRIEIYLLIKIVGSLSFVHFSVLPKLKPRRPMINGF